MKRTGYYSLLLICCLLHVSLFSFAQNNKKADSLLNVLAQSKNDTVSLNLLQAITWEIVTVNGDLDTGEIYINKAFKLADKLIQENAATKNNVYVNKSKNTKATILMTLGLYYHHHGNYGEGIENYFAALRLYMEADNKQGIAFAHNNIGNIYYAENNLEEAMKHHEIALKIRTEIADRQGIANSNSNMGIIYEKQGKYDEALRNQLLSLQTNTELNNIRNIGSNKMEIGTIYKHRGDYKEAMKNYKEALVCFEKENKRFDRIDAYNFIGETYFLMNNFARATEWLDNALALSLKIQTKGSTRDIYFNLSRVYKKQNDFRNAIKYYKLYVNVKDTMFAHEAQDKIAAIKHRIETDKKEAADRVAQRKKDADSEAELNRQKLLLYGSSATLAVVLAFSLIVFYQRKKLSAEKKRSESLLLNIFPMEVVAELNKNGKVAARNFESVTVMFIAFKNFDELREQIPAENLVTEVSFYFSAFDEIIQQYGIEKIKTYGEVYMCAGGVPAKNTTHPKAAVDAAMEITAFMEKNNQEKRMKGELSFEIRTGIHTGSVVAGIVGVKKFAYDIWGDTVNTARRVEQNSESGKINISAPTYALVKNNFHCEYRGKIAAKNKGEVEMYFVQGKM